MRVKFKNYSFLIAFVLNFFLQSAGFSQATYRSKASGNWNTISTWLLLSGTDSDMDGLPDANDTVVIRTADQVTLVSNVGCVNLTILNSGTPVFPNLAIGDFVLQLSGTLNGPNTTYKSNIISCGTGRVKFVGISRPLFGSNWNGYAPDNWRVEIALNPGSTGTSIRSVKVGDLIISSGNFIIGTAATYNFLDLKIDKGAALGNNNGSLYIAPGCKLACMRCGQRTGDTVFATVTYPDTSTFCQIIDIYGELEIHGLYLSGNNINIQAGGKLSIARSNATPMLTNPIGVSNFNYAPGSYLEYRNHSPSSTSRTQTGAEIDQASSWNTIGPSASTVSNLVVNNSPYGIRGNNVVYIEDTLIMTFGYFDNVDMSGAYVRYGSNGTLKYNCPTVSQSAAISHLSIEFPNSFGPASLIIDNPNGVTLDYSRSISGKLNLLRGKLYMFNSLVYLTMTPSSGIGMVSDSSFVSGKIAKTGATPFTFPIGKGNQFRPITVTPVGGTETFIAEYFNSDPNASFSTLNKDLTLNHISRCEYWNLNRTGTKDAQVALSWNSYSCGVDSLNDLRIAQWDGTKWKDRNATSIIGNSNAGTISSTNTINLFGSTRPITLASGSQFNPLPVELILFEAKSFKNYTVLNWETASENSSDYFQVERSSNGTDFTEINHTNAAGNSNVLIDYTFLDEHPLKGIAYYRLNEFDLDGKLALSKTVVSRFIGDKNNLQLFMDNETLQIEVSTLMNENLAVNISDINGRELFSKVIVSNREEHISFSNLTHGFYFVRIEGDGIMLIQKIVYL